MATETTDYHAVLEFISSAKIRDCFIPDPALPESLRSAPEIPYLGLGLSADYEEYCRTGTWRRNWQVLASGWKQIDGVMLMTTETDFDADIRVSISATNERALQDLLLSFPPGRIGFFYCAGEWVLNACSKALQGQVMPSREGYFASRSTFCANRTHPVTRLHKDEYEVVQSQWSRTVWDEVQNLGYNVHACSIDDKLEALCFHWQITPWRNEVHGLQAVRDWSKGYAESVFSSATEEVLVLARLPTCTANLSNDENYLRTIRHIGYHPFYRVHSFRGNKPGSRSYIKVSLESFFGPPTPPKRKAKLASAPTESRPMGKHKDPIVYEFRHLASEKCRLEQTRFLVEDMTLVRRALLDGLAVMGILYTRKLLEHPEGSRLLNHAYSATIPHHQVSDGVLGTITTTRPVPTVVAAVLTNYRDALHFHTRPESFLLIVDSIANPDNLGMILRTADAAGVDGVLVIGSGADPFHKQCVRAGRGAVGRIPLFRSETPTVYLSELVRKGFNLFAATAKAQQELHDLELHTPLAFVVGNETLGITKPVLDICPQHVRIPMAPGQSSLNVGVAAGILLYEFVRQDGRKKNITLTEHTTATYLAFRSEVE